MADEHDFEWSTCLTGRDVPYYPHLKTGTAAVCLGLWNGVSEVAPPMGGTCKLKNSFEDCEHPSIACP